MEHIQQKEYPIFHKNNEDLFLDSLLDLLDDWSDDSSRQTSVSENISYDDDVLVNEIIALSESSLASSPTYNNEIESMKSSDLVMKSKAEPRLCHICGEKAGKHVYYGGQCCPSCRAFFRRSVQNNFFKQFTCTSKTNACVINVTSRKTCQLCRFQRCLSAGMRVSWVLPDGERSTKRPRLSVQSSIPNLEYPGGLTYKEISFVFSIKNSLCNKFLTKVTSLLNSNSDFLMDFVDYLVSPSTSNTSYLRVGMTMEKIEFLSLISQGISPEMKVSKNDMLVLYKYNFRHVFLFRESCSLSKRECPSMNSLIDSVKVLNIKNTDAIIQKIPRMKKFRIEHFTLKYKLNPEEDKRHARLMDLVYQISSWPSENDHERDDFCYVIMIFILFFDLSNGVRPQELDDPEAIEAARLNYVQMLKRYLTKKYPESMWKRFLGGIMLPSLVGEAFQIVLDVGLCTGKL